MAAVERRLQAYLTSLWDRGLPLRESTGRRASYAGGIIALPDHGLAMRRASLAHIAAHLVFGPAPFPIGSLKPMQVATISLVEDARVERLALAELPGLGSLWLPFHAARPDGMATAPILMARLARALIDDDYRDDDGWVTRGRALFHGGRARWCDQGFARELGGLLGNDLGQMRLQFNARDYVVEPAYRDDNLGLWDFGVTPPSDEDAAAVPQAMQPQAGDGAAEHQGGPAGAEAAPTRITLTEAELGTPIARYPEWDHVIGCDRPDWTTLVEYAAPRAEAVVPADHGVAARIARQAQAARPGRPARQKRLADGDQLDLDAAVDAALDLRRGALPEGRVFSSKRRGRGDLAVLGLIDASQSTNDHLGAGLTVLAAERSAAALLAQGFAAAGNDFALHGFCSCGRHDVRYMRLKEFDRPYDAAALAGLAGRFSTRLGAALRHAGRALLARRAWRRVLLVLTDGEPSDIDVPDRRYLVEDARKAASGLRRDGIDVFCLSFAAGDEARLARIFGRARVLAAGRPERLPGVLARIYARLDG
jgi:Mg-chelatase subunit ChlD